MELKLSVKKINLVRPEDNPKNKKVEMNIDWNIECEMVDVNFYKYFCLIEIKNFPILFTAEGYVEIIYEKPVNLSDKILKVMFKHILTVMMEILGITKTYSTSLEEISNLDTKMEQKILNSVR
ncbi:hypothetical protein [Methanocaldococcus vulcanius]|nr:hypothetical protein [Methanocaldococcus vulcanius]